MAGVVQVPWYATVFRGDKLEQALTIIAPVALRYGATDYRVYRYRDDRYKFIQMATFLDKSDWESYWEGPEMTRMRTLASSWYQVPVLYQWADVVTQGSLSYDPGAGGQPSSLSAAGGDVGDTI